MFVVFVIVLCAFVIFIIFKCNYLDLMYFYFSFSLNLVWVFSSYGMFLCHLYYYYCYGLC